MTRENVAVKINDNVGHYFKTRKIVHQEDPLSPIMFNIVVDMLVILISRAKEVEEIQGVVLHLVDDRLSVLQYADDTIIFTDNDLEKVKNYMKLLYAFEQLSGLKINFYKSELFCYGVAKANQNAYAQFFGCICRVALV